MSDIELPKSLPGWIQDHIELYLRDPEKGHMWDSGPLGGPGLLKTLLLTTTGRKSGKPGILPLIYDEADGNYIIVASKGGAPAHPAWYLNLQAQPECQVQVGAKRFTATASDAQGAQRAALWQQMAAGYPPYNDYQAATDREIPVVILTPSD